MEIKRKVLVIGGGPAGSTAAALLASNRIEVTLLEKDLSFRKPCGGGIPSVAFDEFDIPRDQILKEIRKVRLVPPAGETVEVDINPDRLMIVERSAFDNFLRNSARASGAEVLEGKFISAEKVDKLFSCKIMQADREIRCAAEYIIAADGVNSRVRQSQGIGPNSAVYTISEQVSGSSPDACEFWFSSAHAQNFYSWVFPSPEGVSIGTGSSDPRRVSNLLQIFKERIGFDERHYPAGPVRRKAFKIPRWRGDLYNRGNIIFSGDSAGQVMPLSYEGIYYAMKSGVCAAEAVLGGRASLYKKIWESRFFRTFWFCSKLNEYFLKSDSNAERLISLHKKSAVLEIAKNLWLSKNCESKTVQNYIKLVGKLFI